MKDQAADKRSPIIAGALLLTAAFLGLFGWLLSRTDVCPEGWWVWDRVACLDPNALGDTFAGAFAPVAFVWLVAAVLLQRNELAAQRQELRESRAVAAQQVAEARKNVELIGQQTSILRGQREKEEKEEADRDVSALLALFDRTMMLAISDFLINDRNSPPGQDGWGNEIGDCKSIGFEGPFAETREDRCRELIDQVGHLLFEVTELWSSKAVVEYQNADKLLSAVEILRKIDEVRPRSSIATQGMLDFIGVTKGLRNGDELLRWLRQNGVDLRNPLGGRSS